MVKWVITACTVVQMAQSVEYQHFNFRSELSRERAGPNRKMSFTDSRQFRDGLLECVIWMWQGLPDISADYDMLFLLCWARRRALPLCASLSHPPSPPFFSSPPSFDHLSRRSASSSLASCCAPSPRSSASASRSSRCASSPASRCPPSCPSPG